MIHEDLLQDKELVQELLDKISADPMLEKLNIDPTKVQDYLKISQQNGLTEARSRLSFEEAAILEAIIEERGYPSLLIRNNTYEVANSDVWASRLSSFKSTIDQRIASIGRIEFAENPLRSFIGTGWLVADNIIVTNRHVASSFASLKGEEFVFITNQSGVKTEIQIDFREEYTIPAKEEFIITKVLYIEPGGVNDYWNSPDLAFLEVSRQRFDGVSLIGLSASPIPLATDAPTDESQIVVIGYPWEDAERINVQLGLTGEVVEAIFNGIYNVKRLQPGLIKSVEPSLLTHNSSTLRGNSGSVVLDFKTGKAVGLHWGGIAKQANYAVPSTIIEQRLHDVLSGNIKIRATAESTLIIFPTAVDLETIDNKTPIELADTPCYSPLEDQSLEDLILEATPFPAVNTQLPISGIGYYSYAKFREKQFGLSQTIEAINKIGELWFANHRSGPVIGVGNISKNGGGPVPPHSSHQTGLDVDFRLLRSDGARIGITFRDGSYSRTRTQALVNTILSNPVLRVKLILCNDNDLQGVQPWPGHDDHLHVRFIS